MSKTGEKFKTGFIRWEQFDFSRAASNSLAPALTAFCQLNHVVEISSVIEISAKRYLIAYIVEDDETVRRDRNAKIRVEMPEVPETPGSDSEDPTAGPATEELSGL